jgi:large subunit ribosomal protein L44e
MKMPRTLRTYCPRCRTHREFNVTLYKAGKRRAARLGERRQAERKKGYGGQKFPEQHNQAKTTRKQTLKIQCRECGYTLQRGGIRLKKMEVV